MAGARRGLLRRAAALADGAGGPGRRGLADLRRARPAGPVDRERRSADLTTVRGGRLADRRRAVRGEASLPATASSGAACRARGARPAAPPAAGRAPAAAPL